MSTLPAKVATPVLVTGKTDKSQVVDVYEKDTVQTRAQNMINSVLNKANGTVLENTKNAAIKLIDAKQFYPDLNNLLTTFAKGGYTKDSWRTAVGDYKNGALKSILDANGAKDLQGLKDNILGTIENNVKDFSFGFAKGFVDTVEPGLLDSIGVKSFSDAKKLYDNMDAMVSDFKEMNTEAWIDATLPFALGMTTGALQASVDIMNETLGSKLTIKSTDAEIDNAILAGACKDMIGEDNPHLNDFIFTSFDGIANPDQKAAKMGMFISSTVDDAAKKGSMDYLIKAADKTSPSFVRANINVTPDDFLSHITTGALYNEAQRLEAEEKIVKSLSVVSGKKKEEFTLDMFTKLSKDGKETLRYSQEWADAVALSEGLTTYDPLTLPTLYPDYF